MLQTIKEISFFFFSGDQGIFSQDGILCLTKILRRLYSRCLVSGLTVKSPTHQKMGIQRTGVLAPLPSSAESKGLCNGLIGAPLAVHKITAG